MTHDNLYLGFHLIGRSLGNSLAYGRFSCEPKSQSPDNVCRSCAYARSCSYRLPDFPSQFRFHAVLALTVTIGYLCIAIACMEKYNVLKRKNRVLEEALTEKEQEKVSILMEHQSKQQQALQKGELEWFAGKIKMFSEEEQKAILASSYAFAEHDLILQPSITIQPNEMCSQQELMYFVYSAFSNMGKKRSDIVSFLCQVFKAYFPAGESSVSKKMPGLDKVKERREKEKN